MTGKVNGTALFEPYVFVSRRKPTLQKSEIPYQVVAVLNRGYFLYRVGNLGLPIILLNLRYFKSATLVSRCKDTMYVSIFQILKT